MPRTTFHSDRAPGAVGPYSQAVDAGELIFLAGQTPIDPATGALVPGDISAQAEQVMDNIAAVLAAAGLTFDDVVKSTCYLIDFADFPAFNAVYGSRFEAPYPARTTVGVSALPLGSRVEVEMIARRR